MKATPILITDALIVMFLAISFFAQNASAYYYEYRSDCGTGFGGLGTAVQCEPPPIKIPEDCAFKLTQPPDANSRISILQNESWLGNCTGELQQIIAYMPDTTLKQTYFVSCNSNPTWTYQYLMPPQDILSGYGRCLPSVNIQCKQNNTLIVSCWRNSPQLIVNPSFETTYNTTLSTGQTTLNTGKTLLNWKLITYTVPPFDSANSQILNDSWWGKEGTTYLYSGGANTNYPDGAFETDVYFPNDLGNIYNVSFNIEASGYCGYTCCGGGGITIKIVFSDLTEHILASHTLSTCGIPPSQTPYNTSFLTTVNIGTHYGWGKLIFEFSHSGFPSFSWNMKLDNVKITSQCVGTSPNCWNEFQNPPFYYGGASPTTTTTTPGGIPPTGCNVCDPMATTHYGIVGYLFTGLCLLVTLIVCDTLLFALLVVFFILVTIFMYIKGVRH